MSRDLLESAAKAVGMPMIGKWCSDGYELPSSDPVFAPVIWNPLADDGDALRLAVACHIDIRFEIAPGGEVVCAVASWQEFPTRPNVGAFTEDVGSDRNAATRRAIVRAAAEIGS